MDITKLTKPQKLVAKNEKLFRTQAETLTGQYPAPSPIARAASTISPPWEKAGVNSTSAFTRNRTLQRETAEDMGNILGKRKWRPKKQPRLYFKLEEAPADVEKHPYKFQSIFRVLLFNKSR